jgi:hypothetical protein
MRINGWSNYNLNGEDLFLLSLLLALSPLKPDFTVPCYNRRFSTAIKIRKLSLCSVQQKLIYYIPLERAWRGEHKEMNSWNSWAVWEKTEGEVFDPKIKLSNPSHNWSNWHFKHFLYGHKILFEGLVEFQKFQFVRPQTRKSGPKSSCSKSISEHFID